MGQATVLIVDDEQMLLKYFVRFFSRKFSILTAESITEGKQVLAQHSADIKLIISDHQLTDGRGIEFLKEVLHSYPAIVRFLSTGIDSQEVKEAAQAGIVSQVILKPWELDELEQEINNVLSKGGC